MSGNQDKNVLAVGCDSHSMSRCCAHNNIQGQDIRQHFGMERQKRLDYKEEAEGHLADTNKLALGAEIVQGQLERITELKVGDNIREVMLWKRAKALDAAVRNVILFFGRTTDFLIHYQKKSLSQWQSHCLKMARLS